MLGSCLIIAVLLGEEEKTGPNLIRVGRQNGNWSLLSAPPGRTISKAAKPLKTNLGGCGREHRVLAQCTFIITYDGEGVKAAPALDAPLQGPV